ncbi:MAG: VPLPA-CTERM sorting domain-containing protein [Gammaproteobacteria bacterium]|nr:VPLPA-CTERM sorting domain-containing protein [Gammaproteobacteria bacterium]
MKLSSKLKTMVVAIGMVGASQAANAAVVQFDANPLIPSSANNSSILFFAYDSLSGKSFIEGLNKRLDDIVTAPNTTQTFSVAGLNSFFGPTNNAIWGVVAADNVGAMFKGYRNLTSFDSTSVNGPVGVLASGVKNASAAFQAYLVAADKGFVAGTPVTATSSVDPSFAGNGAWADTWGANYATSNAALLVNGATLTAWLYDTANSASGIKVPLLTKLNNWNLNLSTDSLVYAAPAAVPVPAALWMLGSSLMGLVTVGRRRS